MLQRIRESTSGPIAWVIVGIIVLPFAFFGLDQFVTGGSDPVLVEVGSEDITQRQFQRGYQQRYQRLAQMMGENFNPDMIDSPRFRAAVLEDLVQEAMLRQYTERRGYRITDADLFAFIQEIPAFQTDGRFSTEVYRQTLAAQGETPASWEARVRNSLQIDQMRQAVLESAFAAPAEVSLARALEQQQRHLSYARLPVASFNDQVSISDDDMQAFYDSNAQRFTSPERIKLAYVELDREALEPADSPSDDVLRSIYENDKDTRFASPAERRASHILLKFGSDRDASREEIEAIRQRIADGANFGELAEELSEDPGSKNNGGSLGWIRRGQMVEQFEDTLFSMGEGELSDVVETEFGWHLIRVDEIRPRQVKPFEEVRDAVLAAYRQREAERRFEELSDQLEQVAFESPGSLEPVAEATGLEVKRTDWLTRGSATGLASDPAVRDAAFGDDVLAGENSRPIELASGHQVVIRRQEYEAERVRPLDEVRDEVRASLTATRASELAAQRADELLAAVRDGTSLEDAAQAAGASVETPGLIERSNSELPSAIVSTLFTMPRPRDAGATFATAQLGNGDRAVLALTAVQVAEDDTADARVSQRVTNALAGTEFGAYRGHIRDEIDVETIRSPVTDEPG